MDFSDVYLVWEQMQTEDERKRSISRRVETESLPGLTTERCDACKTTHAQYRMSSAELLRYVIRSAGDLVEDLSPIFDGLSIREGETIGDGGFGVVSKATKKIKGKTVVIKLLKFNQGGSTPNCKGEIVVRVSVEWVFQYSYQVSDVYRNRILRGNCAFWLNSSIQMC